MTGWDSVGLRTPGAKVVGRATKTQLGQGGAITRVHMLFHVVTQVSALPGSCCLLLLVNCLPTKKRPKEINKFRRKHVSVITIAMTTTQHRGIAPAGGVRVEGTSSQLVFDARHQSEWKLDPSRLIFTDRLGAGTSAKVYKGIPSNFVRFINNCALWLTCFVLYFKGDMIRIRLPLKSSTFQMQSC